MRVIKLTALLTLSFTAFALASSSLDELKTKAESGDVEAQYKLGSNYRLKQRDKAGHIEAEKWLRMAAEQGHARAQLELGHLYDPQDVSSRALRDYRYGQIMDSIKQIYGWSKREEFINDSAEYVIYHEAQISTHSDKLAYDSVRSAVYQSLMIDMNSEKWYLMAAEQGLAEAQSSLGDLYYFGWANRGNGKRDEVYWYEKAAMQNDITGQVMLWEYYIVPFGRFENLVRAHFWLSIYIENDFDFINNPKDRLSELEKRMTKEQLQEAKLLFEAEKDKILRHSQK